MDLTGIFTIGGKPGLQKLIAQSANGVIVESLTDGKRFNAYSSYKISSLEDISIYAENEDVPLRDVLKMIAKDNKFKELEVPKKGELIDAFNKYLVIDQERVYESDIKKLFSWYNILVKSNILTEESLKDLDEENKGEEKEDIVKQEQK